MSKLLHQVSACSPSRLTGSYIYSIVPTISNGIAAITSADELLVLDRQNLTNPPLTFRDVPKDVTCLAKTEQDQNILICAGREGVVTAFDVRTQTKATSFKQDRPVTALAYHDVDVAIGTELAHQQAIVSLWDLRQNQQRWSNTENNDDITDLNFHPATSNYLLSGGIDGVVSIFDTSIQEEEESLIQALSHGPIHKAGFLGETLLYALSSDEQLSFYPVTAGLPEDDENSPPPITLGDLRPVVACDYVIDLIGIGGNKFVASGSHNTDPRVELIPISEQGKLRMKQKLTIADAQGGEIVRSIYGDFQDETIYTSGEDGFIRAFRQGS